MPRSILSTSSSTAPQLQSMREQRRLHLVTTFLSGVPVVQLVAFLRDRNRTCGIPFSNLLIRGLSAEIRSRRRRREVSPPPRFSDQDLILSDRRPVAKRLKHRQCVRPPIIEDEWFSDLDIDDPSDPDFQITI